MAEKAKTRRRKVERQEPSAEVEALKCKSCGKELNRMLFDSRAPKPVYLYVCDDHDCILYRQPQKCNGELPTTIRIVQ